MTPDLSYASTGKEGENSARINIWDRFLFKKYIL